MNIETKNKNPLNFKKNLASEDLHSETYSFIIIKLASKTYSFKIFHLFAILKHM